VGRVMKTEGSLRFRVGLSGRKRRAGLSGDAVSLVWWCVSGVGGDVPLRQWGDWIRTKNANSPVMKRLHEEPW
jgi:hypothetical protein